MPRTDVSDRAARDLGKVDITGIDAVGTVAGQATMANSLPVTMASDQSDIDVNLATVLSSSSDSIDVDKMSKGSVTTAHSAITATATSAEIDCRGHNAISVECAVSAITAGKWVASILGCAISGGTFGNCYAPKSDGTFFQQKTLELDVNGNYTFLFVGVPNYIKIQATRTTDGTLTCKVTPLNL